MRAREKLDAETAEEYRKAILKGDCPFCRRTGFQSIAQHCRLAHGIHSRDLRDLVGLTYTESICSENLHNKLSVIHKDSNPSLLGKAMGRRTLSVKGRAIVVATASSWASKVAHDVHVASGRKVGLANKGRPAWNRSDDHGRRAMFRRGCRCQPCDIANKEHWREVNKKRSRRQGPIQNTASATELQPSKENDGPSN